MRFVVKDKIEGDREYVITLGNRSDEGRYRLAENSFVVFIRKDARFSSSEKNGLTPEEDNKRWFNSFEIGSEFNLSPKASS